MEILSLTIPLKLVSPNKPMSWHATQRKNKAQRSSILLSLAQHPAIDECKWQMSQGNKIYVKLTYIGRRMDYDNMVYAFKHVRDTIADLLVPGKARGQADSDERIGWFYDQRGAKDYKVSIEIKAG